MQPLSLLAWSPFDPWHMVLLAGLALLFFGNRLPEVARSLGRAVNEFKRGLRDVQDEIGREDPDKTPPAQLHPPRDEPVQKTDLREKETVPRDTAPPADASDSHKAQP